MKSRQLASVLLGVVLVVGAHYLLRQLRPVRRAAQAAPPFVRFRNDLCGRSDAWYAVSWDDHTTPGTVYAGGRLSEGGRSYGYDATANPDGTIVVQVAPLGFAPVAAVTFGGPGGLASSGAPLPAALYERAKEFAGVLARSLQP
jgi:hypothetical protein